MCLRSSRARSCCGDVSCIPASLLGTSPRAFGDRASLRVPLPCPTQPFAGHIQAPCRTPGRSGTPCLSPYSGEQPQQWPWPPPRPHPAHGTYFQNPGKNEDSFLNLCPIPLSGCPWPADLSERNRTEWNSTGAAGRTPRHAQAPTAAAATAPTCARPAGLCTPQPRCPQPAPSRPGHVAASIRRNVVLSPAVLPPPLAEAGRGAGRGFASVALPVGAPGHAASPGRPGSPAPATRSRLGATPGDPCGVVPVAPGGRAGRPPWRGQDPNWDSCPTDAVWWSGAHASHPPHGHGPGSLPRCPVRRLRREQGLCHRLNHFMGRRRPAGRRARGSGRAPPRPGDLLVGDQEGKPSGTLVPPTPVSSSAHRRWTSPYLPQLFFYCQQLVSPGARQAPAEHPLPSAPLGGPASSGTTLGPSHLSPFSPERPRPPRDDFPSPAGWVCSFPCVA